VATNAKQLFIIYNSYRKKGMEDAFSLKKTAIVIFFILLFAGGFYVYHQEQKERYNGMTFIPEHSEDVPLYKGLKPKSPEYTIDGDSWEDILSFYKRVLPEHGWKEIYVQSSPDSSEDGAGFMSAWQKEGQEWELTINASYFHCNNQTEVVFDKREKISATNWIENEPVEICINEQPDRSDDCFKMTDKSTISKIVELVNSASDWNRERTPYSGISTIDFGSVSVEVYYEMDKGIYFVSEKGTKWMKPEQEFFELSRISKEY
jgi:hypothetical protein